MQIKLIHEMCGIDIYQRVHTLQNFQGRLKKSTADSKYKRLGHFKSPGRLKKSGRLKSFKAYSIRVADSKSFQADSERLRQTQQRVWQTPKVSRQKVRHPCTALLLAPHHTPPVWLCCVYGTLCFCWVSLDQRLSLLQTCMCPESGQTQQAQSRTSPAHHQAARTLSAANEKLACVGLAQSMI